MNDRQTRQNEARSESFPIRYSIDRIIVLLIVVLIAWQAVESFRFGVSYLAWATELTILGLIFYAGRLSGQRRRISETR